MRSNLISCNTIQCKSDELNQKIVVAATDDTDKAVIIWLPIQGTVCSLWCAFNYQVNKQEKQTSRADRPSNGLLSFHGDWVRGLCARTFFPLDLHCRLWNCGCCGLTMPASMSLCVCESSLMWTSDTSARGMFSQGLNGSKTFVGLLHLQFDCFSRALLSFFELTLFSWIAPLWCLYAWRGLIFFFFFSHAHFIWMTLTCGSATQGELSRWQNHFHSHSASWQVDRHTG